MAQSRESSELSAFSKEIEKGFFDVEILRNHLAIKIRTPDSWTQEYTVVYRNIKKREEDKELNKQNSLKCIFLPSRLKKVQRNLSVHDREEDRLTVIPSDLIHDALCKICTHYLETSKRLAGEQYIDIFDELIKSIKFENVFSYDSKEEDVQFIINNLTTFIGNHNFNSPDKEKISVYLQRIFKLVRIYRNFYIPFIKLDEPVEPRDCVLLSYSVENVMDEEEQLRDIELYTIGSIKISFPCELESNSSNHIRILAPSGMVFRHAGISRLEGKELIDKYSNLKSFLDDDMIYFHIPMKYSKEIMNQQKTRTNENEIRIDTSLGIDNKFFSLVRVLTGLMYISILIPAIIHFQPWINLDLDFNIISTSVLISLTILVSIAIYAIDKRFLHDFLLGQVVILILLFIIELVFLLYLYETTVKSPFLLLSSV